METCISPAIIMRIKEFGETDLLVTFFTPDKGQQKGVAKGARKSRKRFVNCLDLFSLVNLEYRTKKERDLCFLNSGKLVDAYPGIRCDFSTLTRASYMIELTGILFPSGVADRDVFTLLKRSLEWLAREPANGLCHLVFEARAMTLGGFKIALDKCCICGRTFTGRGMGVFKRENGGIACLNCEKPTRLTPSMRPESINLLGRMQSGLFEAGERLGSIDEIIEDIQPVLKLHREYRLDTRPRTACYLE